MPAMDLLADTRQDRISPRFRWTVFESRDADIDQSAELVAGLRATPRTLPSRYFYDERGSTLFERICELPEYYPTRTEQAILTANAGEIAALVGASDLVELGSGSARKTQILIEAFAAAGRRLRFMPIDISAEILKLSARSLLDRYPDLEVWGLIGTYEQALAKLPAPHLGRRLMIFLGGTIGNFDDAECRAFLTRVRDALSDGDFFLLGFDRQKEVKIVEAAYNDAKGVTAEFNLNMLRHLNARFDGDFQLDRFAHDAIYNSREHQIEMYLESRADQNVALGALDLKVSFAAGERVRTEISRKFDPASLMTLCAEAGLHEVKSWSDARDWFAVSLLKAT